MALRINAGGFEIIFLTVLLYSLNPVGLSLLIELAVR